MTGSFGTATPRITPAVGGIAFLVLMTHVLTNRGYGYFGDELYFLTLKDHLAWGYVDTPPASVAVLKAWTFLFGDALPSLRLLPALSGAATVALTGCLAAQLGGGNRAQTLAAIGAAVAPGYLVVHSYYSMNAFDVLLWTVAASLLVHAVARPSRAAWAALGLVLGLGLLNKLTVLWLGAAIAVAHLLRDHRRLLATPGPWIAAAIAGLLFAPHVVWQASHGWPTVEFFHGLMEVKLVSVSAPRFFWNQMLMMQPIVFGMACAGLGWLCTKRGKSSHQMLAIIYLLPVAVLLVAGTSRAYYVLGAYPPLLAAGGVAIERAASRMRRPMLAPILGGSMVLGGLLAAPLALPLLSVEQVIAYERAVGFEPPTEDRRSAGRLPGYFANRHGWDDVVASVAAVYARLTAQERREAVILAHDYMEAAALSYLGRDLELPPVVGTHNSSAFWGSGGRVGDVLIVLGGSPDAPRRWYGRVEAAGRLECRHCVPKRNGKTIWIATDRTGSLSQLLGELRHLD